MKKKILCSVFGLFVPMCVMASDMLPAGGYYETRSQNCDMAAMQETLDRATADRRAVITVVKCTPRVAAPAAEFDNACMDCGAPIERVVARRVYVEETVQQYRPVVHYVPAGTYTRTRHVCNECNM